MSSINGAISYWKEFALMGANSFFYEMTPIYMEATMTRVALPERVPIHIKDSFGYYFTDVQISRIIA